MQIQDTQKTFATEFLLVQLCNEISQGFNVYEKLLYIFAFFKIC